jgi:hypothetical protein
VTALAAETCSARCLSQRGDENRCAIINEHKSKNLLGTTVGSWVEMMTLIFSWRCCRTMLRSDSVNREEAPFSVRYLWASSSTKVQVVRLNGQILIDTRTNKLRRRLGCKPVHLWPMLNEQPKYDVKE